MWRAVTRFSYPMALCGSRSRGSGRASGALGSVAGWWTTEVTTAGWKRPSGWTERRVNAEPPRRRWATGAAGREGDEIQLQAALVLRRDGSGFSALAGGSVDPGSDA